LNEEKEEKIMRHMKGAELYTRETHDSTCYPRHKKCVGIDIDLGFGREGKEGGEATVLGSSLSHEYVAENADYRS